MIPPALPDKIQLVGRKWNGFIASLNLAFPLQFSLVV